MYNNNIFGYGINGSGSGRYDFLHAHKNIYGYGVNNENIPETVKFGKLILLLNKLYYKNILSLKNASGHAIEHFKNIKVSDTFSDLIYKLCKNENMSKTLFNLLNHDEKELLDTVIYMAGLHKNINNDRSEHVKKLKERLQLVEGEIQSGNDNKEIIKELQSILMKLYHLGIISLVNVKKHMKQFN